MVFDACLGGLTGKALTEYVGRLLQTFTENDMNVTEPTHAGWITRPELESSPPDVTVN